MSGFQGLLPTVERTYRTDSSFRTTESGKSIFINKQDLYGSFEAIFSVDIIPLIDLCIMTDNLHVMSIEQQRLLEKYFLCADRLMNEDEELPKVMKEFDNFLGSYIGE